MRKKVLFVVNDFGFFMSHRLAIADQARDEGFDVWVAAPGTPPLALAARGICAVSISLSRRGVNPVAELGTLWSLFRLFRRLKPDLVHLVTIKPVLYGGMMARLAGVPALVSAISGLGTLFTRRAGWLTRMAQGMYRVALGHSNQVVIFQNQDDQLALVRDGGLDESKVIIIRGSGVDLRSFTHSPEPDGTPVVVMASRLLRDKGLLEFVEAAQLLRARGVTARFLAVGESDPGNPSSVSELEVERWKGVGPVEFPGFRADMARLFADCHLVVLPSYREGLPKVLIEAAACGRAVVTTDVPGCRDAIDDGVTGLLVPARDAGALAEAMQVLLEDSSRRHAMGRAGRALAERVFAIEDVVQAHMNIYHRLLNLDSR